MNIVFTVVSLIILVTGIVLSHKEIKKNEGVLSEASDNFEVDNSQPDQEISPQTKMQSPTPTPYPSPVVSPSEKPKEVPDDIGLDYIYPGSKIIKQEGNNLLLESNDDTGTITNWYKDRIKSLNLNARSFVTTKTNDNVLNKLSGASAIYRVKIEVKREAGSSWTKISVLVENVS